VRDAVAGGGLDAAAVRRTALALRSQGACPRPLRRFLCGLFGVGVAEDRLPILLPAAARPREKRRHKHHRQPPSVHLCECVVYQYVYSSSSIRAIFFLPSQAVCIPMLRMSLVRCFGAVVAHQERTMALRFKSGLKVVARHLSGGMVSGRVQRLPSATVRACCAPQSCSSAFRCLRRLTPLPAHTPPCAPFQARAFSSIDSQMPVLDAKVPVTSAEFQVGCVCAAAVQGIGVLAHCMCLCRTTVQR